MTFICDEIDDERPLRGGAGHPCPDRPKRTGNGQPHNSHGTHTRRLKLQGSGLSRAGINLVCNRWSTFTFRVASMLTQATALIKVTRDARKLGSILPRP